MNEYEQVVVGSSITAVLFAFVNNFPIFFTQGERPFRFDYLKPETDLSFLKLVRHQAQSLTTFDGQKKVGIMKEHLWERLLFLLSLDGKVPLSTLCQTMRYDGERIICSNEYSKIMEFKFKHCYYFGDINSTGFVEQKDLDDDKYICYDYIAFNKGGKHQIDYIQTQDDFVGEIWFYPSDRIDGNTPVKDACAVSILNSQQLLDFDFSQTMARFKVIYEMEAKKMKGPFAHGYTKAGTPKHYKFRTTSLHRTTRKCTNEGESVGPEITLPKISEKDLLERLSAASVAYDRFLKER